MAITGFWLASKNSNKCPAASVPKMAHVHGGRNGNALYTGYGYKKPSIHKGEEVTGYCAKNIAWKNVLR